MIQTNRPEGRPRRGGQPRSASIALLLAALICAPGPALAQGGGGKAEMGPGAEDLLRAAVDELGSARFRQSVELLERAKELTSDGLVLGRIHLYLGINFAVLGEVQRARGAFHVALAHHPDQRLDPRRIKPEVVNLFEEVRRGMLGNLDVSADQAGAMVVVDGEEVGVVPLRIRLAVGPHEIEVRGPAGRHRERVVVFLGQRAGVRAVLTPSAPPERPRRGRLGPAFWVTAAGAVAALGAGLGLTLSAYVDYDEYWATGTTRTRVEELEDTIRAKRIGFSVLYGVGGALAVTAGALYFRDRRRTERRSRETMRVSPLVGDGAGLLVSGEL